MPNNQSVIVTPTRDELDRIRGYKITKWGKFDNYECVHCQYKTLWIAKMEKHQAADAHLWPHPGPPLPEGQVSPDDDVPVYE